MPMNPFPTVNFVKGYAGVYISHYNSPGGGDGPGKKKMKYQAEEKG